MMGPTRRVRQPPLPNAHTDFCLPKPRRLCNAAQAQPGAHLERWPSPA
jgi:hypothetical protein